MTRARAVVVAAGLAAAAVAGGCRPECSHNRDCNVGFDCSADGLCVTSQAGQIRWVSPQPGDSVDDVFTAVVEVTFAGPSATVHVDRAVNHPGDPCAPFLPHDVEVQGKGPGESVTSQVTIPGLRAVGQDFHIAASLTSAGGLHSIEEELHGPPNAYEGATIAADHEADAGRLLTLPMSATFDRPAARAFVFTEPVVGLPSPHVLVGNGVTSVSDVAVPLVHGAEIVWLDLADADGVAHRCGFGVVGTGDDGAGLELGLAFSGPDPGQLHLAVELDREEPVLCSFADPAAGCEPLFQSRAPAVRGDEALRVDTRDGDVVRVAVVPGAAGPPMTAMVRVSFNGEHVGWFGPVAVNPALGQSWVAGTVTVRGALAGLQHTDAFVEGSPF